MWGWRNRARDPQAQQNFDQLGEYLTRLGINDLSMGTADLSFSASTDSAILTVTHGLRATPSVVLVTGTTVVGTYSPVYVAVVKSSLTATTFQVGGRHPTSITRSDVTFHWLAIA